MGASFSCPTSASACSPMIGGHQPVMATHLMHISFVLDSEEDSEFLTDIVITALEGGVGYWSQASSYDSELGTASLITDDDGFGTHHEIDRDVIAAGIKRVVEAPGPFYAPNASTQTQCEAVPFLTEFSKATVAAAVVTRDASFIDADMADVIVQVALFGRVVYG